MGEGGSTRVGAGGVLGADMCGAGAAVSCGAVSRAMLTSACLLSDPWVLPRQSPGSPALHVTRRRHVHGKPMTRVMAQSSTCRNAHLHEPSGWLQMPARLHVAFATRQTWVPGKLVLLKLRP